MPTYIFKNDEQLGPFEDSDIIESLRAGTYSYDDWCWKEGWEEWKPLRATFPEPPSVASTPPETPVAKTKGKLLFPAIGAAIALLLVLYIASPYYSLWRLKRALSDGDRTAIESLIDFPSVRESLKDQIRVQMTKKMAKEKGSQDDSFATGLAAAFGPAIINYFIDNFVTPSGIASLIADSKGAMEKTDDDGSSKTKKKIDWSKVKRCSFGGPTVFVVDIDGTKLFLGFTGMGWRVKNLEIPAD